jgi:hypothetical protein
MAHLPTGTDTFLFTDIEGSTRVGLCSPRWATGWTPPLLRLAQEAIAAVPQAQLNLAETPNLGNVRVPILKISIRLS